MDRVETLRAASEIHPAENSRRVYRHDLRPAILRAEEASEFARVMREYDTTLNTAVWDKELTPDLAEDARTVVRYLGYRQELLGTAKNPPLEKRSITAEAVDQTLDVHTQRVYSWFAQHYPGIHGLLSSYTEDTPEAQRQLHTVMGETLSHWITIRKGLGAAFRKELEHEYLQDMARFLLEKGKPFKDLAKSVHKNSQSVLEDVSEVFATSRVDEEVLRLDASVAAFEMRDWIGTTATEARSKGRKIYLTPFYTDTVTKIHETGRKNNGIGRVILYGPPGTGKTQLVQEANRQQGFETRVINIHHYTSFADLIAEKAVQVGVKGAPIVQQTEAVLAVFAGQEPEAFGKDFTALVDTLKREGKVPPDETAAQFLSSLVSDKAREVLDKESLEPSDWKLIQDDFITHQRVRMLRTTLPGSYQEVVEDVVKGEILLAIKNGQRVVLDELDKAGPNALGGLLTFLSASKDSTLEYGDTKVTIPSWFTVDGTSNNMHLDTYLTDRFEPMVVDTPPTKDQLMISTVRLADYQGNILLTPYQQRQLASFFMYMVPEINEVLQEGNNAPLSNRAIQQITSYLVDYDTMTRTPTSVGQAVERLIESRKIIARKPDTIRKLDGVLKRYKDLLQEPATDLREDHEAASVTSLDRRRDAALQETIESSLITVMNALPARGNEGRDPRTRQVQLSEKQKTALAKVLGQQRSERVMPDMKRLPVGFALEKEVKGTDVVLRLVAVSARERSQILHTTTLPHDGRIIGASTDGSMVVIGTPQQNDNQELVTGYNVFRQPADKVTQDGLSIDRSVEVQVDARGNKIAFFESRAKKLTVHHNKETESIDGVTHVQLAKSGNSILVEKDDGATQLLNATTLSVRALLPGKGWIFIGDGLVVQKNENGSIEQKALLVA